MGETKKKIGAKEARFLRDVQRIKARCQSNWKVADNDGDVHRLISKSATRKISIHFDEQKFVCSKSSLNYIQEFPNADGVFEFFGWVNVQEVDPTDRGRPRNNTPAPEPTTTKTKRPGKGTPTTAQDAKPATATRKKRTK